MLKLVLKSGVFSLLLIVAVGSGIQFDESSVDNEILSGAVGAWNESSKWLHNLLVEHDDEVKQITRSSINNATDVAITTVSKIGSYAEENKDEIKGYAEKAGESIGEVLTKD
ncbi:MAG: hypothetical protein D6160_09350 [Ketobacter sp.]|nr:MAG: hypothetical protein D6160_09350 [Ketobacter sp.]